MVPYSRHRLLSAFSCEDRALLQPDLHAVSLGLRQDVEGRGLRQDVEGRGRCIEHVFFPESCIISVVAVGGRKRRIEVGLIGREGVSGSAVILGDDRSPHETHVQLAGSAQRIAAAKLRFAMEKSPTLQTVLLRYLHAFATQTAFTALSNGSANIEERLSRWILMSHDRIDGDELHLTHEFLAVMLGVRRPGVTLALHILQGNGLIRSRRRRLQIVNREGLEESANGSYGQPEAEYRRLFS